MQGAPKRQVNAEDMLAELKRVVEASTHAPQRSVKLRGDGAQAERFGPGDLAIANRQRRRPRRQGESRQFDWTAGSLSKVGQAKLQTLETDGRRTRAGGRSGFRGLCSYEPGSRPAGARILRSRDGGRGPVARPAGSQAHERPPLAVAARLWRNSSKRGLGAGRGESGSRRVASCLFRLSAGSARTAAAHAELGARPGAHGTDRAGRSAARNGALPSLSRQRRLSPRRRSRRPPRKRLARAQRRSPRRRPLPLQPIQRPQRPLLPRRRSRRPPSAASQAARPGAAPLATAQPAPASTDSAPSAPPLAEAPKPTAARKRPGRRAPLARRSRSRSTGAAPQASQAGAPGGATRHGAARSRFDRYNAAPCRDAEAERSIDGVRLQRI